MLASLENQGFIEKNRTTQTYKLGIILLNLGNIVSSGLEIRKIALPVMKEIAEKTGETVDLNIIQEGKRICIEKVDGKFSLRQFVEIGRRLPLYKGAFGKLLLAYLPKEEQKEILYKVKYDLKKSIKEALAELDDINEKGFAVSQNERVMGAAAVSAPILNKGNIIAGLTISGASIRFTEDKVKYHEKLIVKGAQEISKRVGYQKKYE